MPARLRDIKRALEARGISVEEPKGSSHWKATAPRITYTIPAHNGLRTEITDIYIRALCRAFALDYETFKREL